MKLRKGFTLVELLIVIVIIGILAAAMLLSSGSATDSAEASNIVTNLRGLKSASLMLYADSMDEFAKPTGDHPAFGTMIEILSRYMDRPDAVKAGGYVFAYSGNHSKWYVGYNISGKTDGVKEKVAGRSVSQGLYNGTNTAPSDPLVAYTAGDYVWMVAR